MSTDLAVREPQTVRLCECGCGRPAPISNRHRPERGQVKGESVRFVRGHAMRGKIVSAETRRKMSAAQAGKTHTSEVRAAMGARAVRGPDHPQWKGDGAAYSTLHRWLSRVAVKTGTCSACGNQRRTQWANLSGEYRRDLSDFAEMCASCHRHFDNFRRAGRGSSRFLGVFFNTRNRNWCVGIKVDGCWYWGGAHATEEAAGRAASALRQRLLPFNVEEAA